ncbi:MAG: stage II sporulation protein M [Firmicutes bacterium]|nr:stage II sporulation protein M [Bacillota bacterium]
MRVGRGWGWGRRTSAAFRRHALEYVAAAACLLAGSAAGALAVGGIGPAARARLVDDLQSLFHASSSALPAAATVFGRALEVHAATAALLWGAAFTALGLVLVPVVLFARGFSLGFAAGFLVYEGGWPGFLLVAASLFPSQAVLIPLWIGLAGAAWRLAFRYARQRAGAGRVAWPEALAAQVPWAAAAGLGVLAASLLDAYLAPVALHAVLRAIAP